MGPPKACSGAVYGVEVFNWVLEGERDVEVSFLAVIWHIWKERSIRCFKGVAMNGDSLCGKIKFCVGQWAMINPIFRDYSLDQIMLNWKDVAFQ